MNSTSTISISGHILTYFYRCIIILITVVIITSMFQFYCRPDDVHEPKRTRTGSMHFTVRVDAAADYDVGVNHCRIHPLRIVSA